LANETTAPAVWIHVGLNCGEVLSLEVNETSTDAALDEIVPSESVVYFSKCNEPWVRIDDIGHLKDSPTKKIFFNKMLEVRICIILI
jgi:hypothetical protein